jgi:hypothetical protein
MAALPPGQFYLDEDWRMERQFDGIVSERHAKYDYTQKQRGNRYRHDYVTHDWSPPRGPLTALNARSVAGPGPLGRRIQ